MEWKEVRLGDVCSKIGSGATPSGGKEAYKGGDYHLIRSQNVLDFAFSKDGLASINDEQANKLKNVEIIQGDVLLNITGDSVARCCIVPSEILPARVNQHVAIIRPRKEELDNHYLLYYLQYYKRQLLQIASAGATRNAITKAMIENLILPCPKSLDDQRRIASILSSLDRKIELNNKINADLEEMAQAIFKNCFVDFEPFKDGKFVDSELGMIPEGWKVGCLGDLITIKYGKDHKKLDDGTFPVYGSGGFMRFVNSWLYNGESVLIPRKGTLDNIMYVCEKFWTVDTMFFSVPKMDYVMKYVYNYIKRFDFSKMNEGTSVPSNTAARLNKMQILIPTHEVLEMYDETLCPIYNKRKMNDKESRTLFLLRDTLLPRLMSGELEVPE